MTHEPAGLRFARAPALAGAHEGAQNVWDGPLGPEVVELAGIRDAGVEAAAIELSPF